MTNKIKCLLIFAGLTLSFGTNIAYAEINKDSPIIDSYVLDVQSSIFSFDESGKLVDGPKRGVDEPIDYSSLLKEIYMRSGFELGLLGCIEKLGDCYDFVRKFDSKNITLTKQIENKIVTVEDLDDFSKIKMASLDALGFEVGEITDSKNAQIIVVLGSSDYLLENMIKNSEETGISVFKRWENATSKSSVLSLWGLFGYEPPYCYVSEKEWANNQQIYIYLNVRGINDCLSISLASAIGLRQTPLDIPSITDIGKKYKVATFADKLYVQLLYHNKFPTNASLQDIVKFWDENARPAWQELVVEMMDNK